jgi:hypothetical protein
VYIGTFLSYTAVPREVENFESSEKRIQRKDSPLRKKKNGWIKKYA